MKELPHDHLTAIEGGYFKALWAGLVGAIGFALGEDFEEVWNEGWNDPYGKD
ncbi:hypothetical protein [Neolewinella litorea]|uniref:hypothetical protein n=1 Tax=Neolewinella litorea TaxID=2562452 RepID=UPI0014560624|nr:hypothetical protein [Neolewinella litorea]